METYIPQGENASPMNNESGTPIALVTVGFVALAAVWYNEARGRRGSFKRMPAPRKAVVSAVRSSLSPELLKANQKGAGTGPLAGHCYVAAQAAYHLLGGRSSGLTPHSASHRGGTHWWLEDESGEIVDPTAAQWKKPFPYQKGTGRGFLTKDASARAQIVIERAADKLRQPSGSRSVVLESGYHRTAIQRNGISRPLKYIQKHSPDLLHGKVLDFGSGKGADCQTISATCYDPNHPDSRTRTRPSRNYDTVLMFYVLNVLPPASRRKALKEGAARLEKGGHLVVAVRGKGDGGYATAKSTWERHQDGYAQRDGSGECKRFQKFFSQSDLRKELRKTLPSWKERDVGNSSSDSSIIVLRKP
jgi:hypothetical protein